jgi:hypothetical protein
MVYRRPEELYPGGDRASVIAKKRGSEDASRPATSEQDQLGRDPNWRKRVAVGEPERLGNLGMS